MVKKYMRIPQIKARGPLLWWGKFRFMYSHALIYVGMVQLTLIALMAYETTVRPWANEYFGWNITFWQYTLVLVLSVFFGVLVEFIISVPAVIAVSNEQMYKHQSPIKTDFEDVKREQRNQGRKLDKILEHLGIADE